MPDRSVHETSRPPACSNGERCLGLKVSASDRWPVGLDLGMSSASALPGNAGLKPVVLAREFIGMPELSQFARGMGESSLLVLLYPGHVKVLLGQATWEVLLVWAVFRHLSTLMLCR